MDDGSIQNKGLHLNVYGFTLIEVIKLKSTPLGRKSICSS